MTETTKRPSGRTIGAWRQRAEELHPNCEPHELAANIRELARAEGVDYQCDAAKARAMRERASKPAKARGRKPSKAKAAKAETNGEPSANGYVAHAEPRPAAHEDSPLICGLRALKNLVGADEMQKFIDRL